ncbi:YraN family protein [Erythrobacter sp. LQ02-29]|uniref:YraN family protein n=1 Tax=unclassified Erythrobacter TaxID=2633097 RepID=UPI001BFC02D9|nr:MULTISPECIES: YraN family protein [unclassified Erythrobacter]MCP9223214.1 YraN family protein [Erythrobacter sp. LQ02-29]QWC58173.1 YraN family protein [Erythrobacter sp. 3-20A1M]
MKRQRAESAGREGERQAALYLQLKGWRILDRRRKTPLGEIDLVARRGNLVAFIEVKWRRKASDLDTAIDEFRLRRVAAAVGAVAHEYATQGEDIRIDVLLMAPRSMPRHIVNAWMP